MHPGVKCPIEVPVAKYFMILCFNKFHYRFSVWVVKQTMQIISFQDPVPDDVAIFCGVFNLSYSVKKSLDILINK